VTRIGKLLAAVLRSRAGLLVGTTGACLAAGIGYALLAADHYRASAILFVDPGALEAAAPGSSAAAVRTPDLDLLRSERVAQRVAENERLVEAPQLRRVTLAAIDDGRPPIEALAQHLAGHVDAAAGGEGGVVNLSVTLDEPQLAARVANAYARAWGEVSLELRAASIRSGIERAHEDLVALRARLGAARALHDGGDRGALAAAGARAEAQFSQLSRMAARPLRRGEALPASLAVPAVRDETVDGPAALASMPAAGAAALGTNAALDPSWGATPRASDRRAAPPAAVEPPPAATADDEIHLAQQSLERAEERLAQLSAQGIGAPFPVHILRAARVPDASTKPTPLICAATALGGGLLLGLLAVALAERLDRRVRRATDVARGLGIVVLGNLPAAHAAGPEVTRGAVARPRAAGRVRTVRPLAVMGHAPQPGASPSAQ
jgi:succinoglycan biosynthesis transport protein ExoP